MGLLADQILDQIRSINDPIKTVTRQVGTGTGTQTNPQGGLDLGSLMMMLMFSGAFKQPGGDPTGGMIAGLPPGLGQSTMAGPMGGNPLTPEMLQAFLNNPMSGMPSIR